MERNKTFLSFAAVGMLIILCAFSIFLPVNHVYASDKLYSKANNALKDENTRRLIDDFLTSDIKYDVGLYDDLSTAFYYIAARNPQYKELYESYTTAELLRMLMLRENQLNLKNAEGICFNERYSITAEGEINDDYYNFEQFVASSGKAFTVAKYIGSATPIDHHPAEPAGAVLTDPGSYYYNCHSYAWLYCGNVPDIPNASIHNLRKQNSDTSYHPIQIIYGNHPTCAYQTIHLAQPTPTTYITSQPISIGDIIVYYREDLFPEGDTSNDNLALTLPKHSAVVVDINGSTYGDIILQSKWGYYGVYSHNLFNNPYFHTPDEGAPQHPQDIITPISVFRPTHSFSYTYNSYEHQLICYNSGCFTEKPSAHNLIYNYITNRYECFCGYFIEPYKFLKGGNL